MKLYTSEQAKLIDKTTIEKYKIPGMILMENAGMSLADEIEKRYCGKIIAVCGKGNNGGDASVAIRHLFTRGFECALLLLCDENDLSGDAKTAFEMAKNIGVPICFKADFSNYDVIIDGIFGIGLSGEPKGVYKEYIDYVNQSGAKVVSVDVPSGGDAGTGNVFGTCIRADLTVTFGMAKTGHFCYPLRDYVGELVIKPISFAPIDMECDAQTIEEIEIPEVPEFSHKGTQGKLFVLSGSVGMTGAATLNCMSAMHSGCGVVTLGIPKSLNHIMEEKLTEVMTLPLEETDGVLSAKALPKITETAEKYNAVLCGSGLSVTEDTKEIVKNLILNYKKTLVLDADALNSLSGVAEILKKRAGETIITPHIGEMARLTGLTAEEVSRDTVSYARDFAKEYKVTVVLKSAHTVIASPDGKVYINTFGNGGMATAGSGDVLAGAVASYAVQGFDMLKSAIYGVYVHAKAGDKVMKKFGKRFITASDIIANLRD